MGSVKFSLNSALHARSGALELNVIYGKALSCIFLHLQPICIMGREESK